jgi:hypothetical protein
MWLLVAVALFGFVSGCGDDDEGTPAPTPPTYSGKEAAQASLGVAFTTFDVIGGIFDGIPIFGKTAPAAQPSLSLVSGLNAAAVAKDRVLAVAGGGPIPCPGGGSQEVSCTPTETSSHLSGVFTNCVETSGGYFTTTNGSITMDVQDPLACGYKGFPDSVAVTIAFNNFSVVVKDSQDVTIDTFTANMTIVMEPTGAGCEGQDGTIRINGTMNAVSVLEALNIQITADNLTLTQTTVPGDPCTSVLAVTGGAVLSDGEETFSETFVDFVVTTMDFGTYDCVTVDGTVSTNCTGSLTYDTVESVYTNTGADCPYAGVVRVTLGDDTVAEIVFTKGGGVTFDYPVDGTVDDTFATCDDANITTCVNPSS